MVVWEIDVGKDPTILVPGHAGIVPVHKNHTDAGATPIPENHIDAGIVLILGSRVDVGTDHVHAGILTEVQIPRGATVLQCCYGCYEPRLTKSRSIAVLEQHQTGPIAEQIYMATI